jgi:hypothetical protein
MWLELRDAEPRCCVQEFVQERWASVLRRNQANFVP